MKPHPPQPSLSLPPLGYKISSVVATLTQRWEDKVASPHTGVGLDSRREYYWIFTPFSHKNFSGFFVPWMGKERGNLKCFRSEATSTLENFGPLGEGEKEEEEEVVVVGGSERFSPPQHI